MTDSARSYPKVVRWDVSASCQAELHPAKFFAKIQVVRNDDSSLDALLQVRDFPRAPTPLNRPKIELADRNERKGNRFSLHVGTVKLSSGIPLFIEIGKNVGVEKNCIHSQIVRMVLNFLEQRRQTRLHFRPPASRPSIRLG